MMMRKRRPTVTRAFVALAAVAVLSGCAMKGDIRQLQVEIRALAARQDSVLVALAADFRAETQNTQDTLRTQSNQLFEFRGDINQSLRAMSQSLSTIEAMVGENQRGIAGVRDQLANMRRAPGGQPQIVTTDPGSIRGGGNERLIAGGGTPDELWAAADQQYTRGSLNTAREAFQEFLREYPGHGRAPDAHFFLADILAQQDRPEDAIEAFLEIRSLFPTAARVPAAMYRIGVLQIQMGNREDAKATLERIVNTYPNDVFAMLARVELKAIG